MEENEMTSNGKAKLYNSLFYLSLVLSLGIPGISYLYKRATYINEIQKAGDIAQTFFAPYSLFLPILTLHFLLSIVCHAYRKIWLSVLSIVIIFAVATLTTFVSYYAAGSVGPITNYIFATFVALRISDHINKKNKTIIFQSLIALALILSFARVIFIYRTLLDAQSIHRTALEGEYQSADEMLKLCEEKINRKKLIVSLDDIKNITKWQAECMLAVAKREKDESICTDRSHLQEFHNECLFEMNKEKDVNIRVASCSKVVALTQGNTYSKESLAEKQIRDKEICLKQVAIEEGIFSICMQISHGNTKDLCLRFVGSSTGEVEACNLIRDRYNRSHCMKGVALQTRDESLCIDPQGDVAENCVRDVRKYKQIDQKNE